MRLRPRSPVRTPTSHPTRAPARRWRTGPSSSRTTWPPELQNPLEVQERLEEAYPERLKEREVGGAVTLWLHVGEDGRLVTSRIAESSEHDGFDRAAREVVEAMRFSPARSGDEPTAVWVQQKVMFRVD